MRSSQNTESLESRIQYRFRNPALLEEALTHPSVPPKKGARPANNQRLEFLGDAVLQLVLSETIFRRMPQCDEGLMTKLRTRLVSERALARMARAIGLGADVRLGKSVDVSRGRDRDSTLSDALEALMGAVYLDAGFEAAQSFVLRVADMELREVMEKPVDVNPKGDLQELLQAALGQAPDYEILQEEGPAHERIYKVVVSWKSMELGQGRGSSKKLAEVEAAADALSGAPLKELLRKVAPVPQRKPVSV